MNHPRFNQKAETNDSIVWIFFYWGTDGPGGPEHLLHALHAPVWGQHRTDAKEFRLYLSHLGYWLCPDLRNDSEWQTTRKPCSFKTWHSSFKSETTAVWKLLKAPSPGYAVILDSSKNVQFYSKPFMLDALGSSWMIFEDQANQPTSTTDPASF